MVVALAGADIAGFAFRFDIVKHALQRFFLRKQIKQLVQARLVFGNSNQGNSPSDMSVCLGAEKAFVVLVSGDALCRFHDQGGIELGRSFRIAQKIESSRRYPVWPSVLRAS